MDGLKNELPLGILILFYLVLSFNLNNIYLNFYSI